MKYILFIGISVLLTSCSFDVKMKYNETQCADEWHYDPDMNIHKNNIKQYLLTKGIETGEIQIEHTPVIGMVCEACSCPSDRIVHITVSADDKAKAIDEGFIEY